MQHPQKASTAITVGTGFPLNDSSVPSDHNQALRSPPDYETPHYHGSHHLGARMVQKIKTHLLGHAVIVKIINKGNCVLLSLCNHAQAHLISSSDHLIYQTPNSCSQLIISFALSEIQSLSPESTFILLQPTADQKILQTLL